MVNSIKRPVLNLYEGIQYFEVSWFPDRGFVILGLWDVRPQDVVL